MTRKEHLEFCNKCLNRKADLKQGLICNITQQPANFEGSCENYKLDETVKEKVVENYEVSNEEIIRELDDKAVNKLRIHQDFSYAIAGGLLITLISAVIWAIITVATEYQIGFMAIGVGLLVGFSIQFFGAGIDKKFGYLGAILSIVGCLLGNLFSQVGFMAQEQSLGYLETLTYLNFGLIINILIESFSPMDLLFYGIAVYEGYRFAFRRVSVEVLSKLQLDDYEGYPSNYRLRMPLVIVSLMVLSFFVYKINKGISGFKTFQYESGKKMSEGDMKNSKEHGKWTYWHENGNKQSIGFYTDGIPDSLWQWFNETGELFRTGNYKKGLEHGTWLNYYENGSLSDSGNFYEGRMNGLWKYWFENGNLFQSGYYKRNLQDSIWTVYYEDGQINTSGKMKDNKPSGIWTTYHTNGQLINEIVYGSENKIIIKNAWDLKGNQLVKNGNGFYGAFSDAGELIQKGKVEDGKRVGKWTMLYENGHLKEEGKYNDEVYELLNSWDLNGNQNVKNGFGIYSTYFADGKSIFETGEVKNGLKVGQWKIYYESTGNLYQEIQYQKGNQTGLQNLYYESGLLFATGETIDGLREGEWNWYSENGNIASNVNFIKDKKEGKQTIWSEVGEKTKEEYYENGELIEEKIF